MDRTQAAGVSGGLLFWLHGDIEIEALLLNHSCGINGTCPGKDHGSRGSICELPQNVGSTIEVLLICVLVLDEYRADQYQIKNEQV